MFFSPPSDLLNTMKTGQWRIRWESYGKMRPKSTGLDQMEGPILGRRVSGITPKMYVDDADHSL